jgi:hypothetical protein
MAKKETETGMTRAREESEDVGLMTLEGDWAKSLLDEGFRAEKTVNLEEGDAIRGVLLGRGVDVEMEDQKTHEVRKVPTYRIANGQNLTINVIGAAQLAARLESILKEAREHGDDRLMEVVIRHAGQGRTRKGNIVNLFDVFSKPYTGDPKPFARAVRQDRAQHADA